MSDRAVRGGGWSSEPWSLRSALRNGFNADIALNFQGFRLVQENAAKPDLVLRGGSWINIPARVRSADRFRLSPGNEGRFLGFRLVQEVGDE